MKADLSNLTVLLWDSRFSAKSHGMPRKSHNFWKPHIFQRKPTIFLFNHRSRIKPFSKTNSATKNKSIQVGQGTELQESKEERLFSIVRKNKTESRSSLQLHGTLSNLLAMKLQYPEESVPCFKFCPTQSLLKSSKKAATAYNAEH